MHRHILGGGEHLIEMLERQGMWSVDEAPKPRVRAARG